VCACVHAQTDSTVPYSCHLPAAPDNTASNRSSV